MSSSKLKVTNGATAAGIESVVAACSGAEVSGDVLVALVREYLYTVRFAAAHGAGGSCSAKARSGSSKAGDGGRSGDRCRTCGEVAFGEAVPFLGGGRQVGSGGSWTAAKRGGGGVHAFQPGPVVGPESRASGGLHASDAEGTGGGAVGAAGVAVPCAGVERGDGDGLESSRASSASGASSSSEEEPLGARESGRVGRVGSPRTPVAWRTPDWRAERARFGGHVSIFEGCEDGVRKDLRESYAAVLIARNKRQLAEEEAKRKRAESPECGLDDVVRVGKLVEKLDKMAVGSRVTTWGKAVARECVGKALASSGVSVPSESSSSSSSSASSSTGSAATPTVSVPVSSVPAVVPKAVECRVSTDNLLVNRFATDVEAKALALGLLSSRELEELRQRVNKDGCFLSLSDIKRSKLVQSRASENHMWIMDEADEAMTARRSRFHRF